MNNIFHSYPLIRASIDIVQGNFLHGWIYGYTKYIRPVLLVNGRVARAINTAVARPDVCDVLGLSPTETPGFVFELSGACPGDRIELWAATDTGCFLTATSTCERYCSENNLISQIDKAARIGRDKDTVGIICPDGSDVGISRAMDLYEIASTGRNAILVCYMDLSSPKKTFRKLQNWHGNLVAIPVQERVLADRLIAAYNLCFNTIWISMPDISSFHLAALLSHEETRYMLDLDNSRYISTATRTPPPRSDGKKEYSFRLCDFLCDQIAVRTTSGLPADDAFREYAIWPVPLATPPQAFKTSENIQISYIGEISADREIEKLARAIQLLNTSAIPLKLAIYGNVASAEQREYLLKSGASIHDSPAPMDAVKIVAESQVIIGTLPQSSLLRQERRDCHISSLVAEGLAAGKPVLLADQESVRHLEHIPGIYLFTEENFSNQLLKAVTARQEISLPDELSRGSVYKIFESACAQAMPCPQIDNLKLHCSTIPHPEPAVVLVWKIHDAGIYGRRIDQIARGIQKIFKNVRIIIVEFYNDDLIQEIQNSNSLMEDDFADEKHIKYKILLLKKHGLEQNGITYHVFKSCQDKNSGFEFKSWLIHNHLLPINTLFILFPIINEFDIIADIIEPYSKIVDIVDNEFGWAHDNDRRAKLMSQYFKSASFASDVMFNSQKNRDFFAKIIFPCANIHVIPNWYSLPPDFQPSIKPIDDDNLHIFYSGNMNDRIDWKMLLALCSIPGVVLHLAGTAENNKDRLLALIECGAIYHGVLEEAETLAWLSQMDAGIVAHREDHISTYMDPIKTRMYEAVGLRVILPKWLAPLNYPYSYENVDECIKIVKNLAKREISRLPVNACVEAEARYMEIIKKRHPAQNIS